MLFLIILLGVLFVVFATAKLKLHPFIALILSSFFVGIASGMPLLEIVTNVNAGFGSLMTSIGIVIVAGTMIGVIRIVGPKRPQLAMSIIGFIVSIPVFCDSGFIILSSLQKSLAKRAKVTVASMGVALATGLYATHVLVPPTPGPIAAAGNIGATDYLGTVILVGLLVAIPATFVGYLWSVKVATKIEVPLDKEEAMDYEDVIKSFGEMPSTFKAFFPIVLPIMLIGIGSIAALVGDPDSTFNMILRFLGSPVVALLLGVFAAFPLLPNYGEETLTGWIGDSLKDAAPILLITAAGGSFGTVIKETGVGDLLQEMDLGALATGSLFLLVPFFISAALKTAQGSSTTALVITSTLVAPMLVTAGIEGALPLALVVMAIGAGAMTVSHVNDSFFWVVTQYSGMKITQAYKAHTMATLLQGITTIIVSIIIWVLFV